MFPSWWKVRESRPHPANFCERCGVTLDLDPDYTADRQFKGKRKTKCAHEIIDPAAEKLANE